MRALLRRSGITNQAESSAILENDGIRLDTEKRTVIKDGTVVDLTSKEFDLLELLMKNAGRVYSRENLLNIIWGYEYRGDIRTVDVHVHRIRDKLEQNPAEPRKILTKWGVGYYYKD